MKKTLWLLLLSFSLFGCKKDAPQEEIVAKDDYVYPFVYTIASQIAISEKPDMRRVLLIGEEARKTETYFKNAGVKAESSIQGKYDAVIVACDGMSKESCSRMLSLLTENGIAVWMMDVSAVKMGEFQEMLGSFACSEAHLWMPSANRWVVVGRNGAAKIKLSAIMEAFTRENAFEDLAKASLNTIAELFASYVGKLEDIMPAFEGAHKDAVVKCEYFLPREISKIDWISEDVDEDILKPTLTDIRSMQVIRRLIVESAINVAEGDEEAAIDKLSRAALRNPHDPMLLERIDRLDRNAAGFLQVGKVLMAMKCYEYILGIQPNDIKALTNIGICFKTIGKLDLAEKAFERVCELSAE